MTNAATLHVVPGSEPHSLEGVVTLASPQLLRGSTNSPAAATKVVPGSRLSPHEAVLLPPVPGRPPIAATAACPTSVISEGLTRLIFRNGDSSPTSDVPSLSDGDSDPPSAPCEAPELTEHWPGSAQARWFTVTHPLAFSPLVLLSCTQYICHGLYPSRQHAQSLGGTACRRES
jgi:hypothetical protein